MAVKERAGDEWNDRLNTLMLARAGMLHRAVVVITEEPETAEPDIEEAVLVLDEADPDYVAPEADRA